MCYCCSSCLRTFSLYFHWSLLISKLKPSKIWNRTVPLELITEAAHLFRSGMAPLSWLMAAISSNKKRMPTRPFDLVRRQPSFPKDMCHNYIHLADEMQCVQPSVPAVPRHDHRSRSKKRHHNWIRFNPERMPSLIEISTAIMTPTSSASKAKPIPSTDEKQPCTNPIQLIKIPA